MDKPKHNPLNSSGSTRQSERDKPKNNPSSRRDSTRRAEKVITDKSINKALNSLGLTRRTGKATSDKSLNEAFLQLRDDLLARKGQVMFLLKALAAMATDSSSQRVWPDEWEIYQATQLAEETLDKMMG